MKKKIEEIYSLSDLNVMIWNDSYSKKGEDAVVSVEKDTIYKRHIKGNEPESLITVINDLNIEKCLPSNRFNKATYHCLSQIGLFEQRNAIIKRLMNSFTIIDSDNNTKIFHPQAEWKNRGALKFCKFKIDSNYASDRRWSSLGDVLVKIMYSDGERESELRTYLIHSGRVITLLSHSTLLRTQKMSLDMKRKLTKKFVDIYHEKELTGYLFL